MPHYGILNKKTLKSALIVLLINSVLGTVIACFMFSEKRESFVKLLLVSQIFTHTVSSCAFLASYFLRPIVLTKFSFARYSVLVASILGAAFFGIFAGTFLVNLLLPAYITGTSNKTVGILIPSLLITIVFTAFFTVLGRFKEKQRNLEKDILKYRNAEKSGSDRHLSLKDDDLHRLIEYKDIIYLSSSGRSSIVHTTGRDYEVRQLLGDMLRILPERIFIRIHKRFMVNERFIAGLRYYEGGRYNIHLSDDDESVLPVGKAFTTDVKRRMNIS